jgi:Protein of unknown function (DUF3617)
MICCNNCVARPVSLCNSDHRMNNDRMNDKRMSQEQPRRVSVATKGLVWGVIIFSAAALWSVDSITPLNVKEGLWEMTVTHSMAGMPAAPNLPPDALAKLPPDQRARIEAMMNGSPSTDVHKECVTQEKLEQHSAFSANRGSCARTVTSSTGSKMQVKFHCEDKQTTSDGSLLVEAISSDNVKATMHSVSNSNGHTMNMDFVITSKYLGPACGDVK